jgi:hypothetical protein
VFTILSCHVCCFCEKAAHRKPRNSGMAERIFAKFLDSDLKNLILCPCTSVTLRPNILLPRVPWIEEPSSRVTVEYEN